MCDKIFARTNWGGVDCFCCVLGRTIETCESKYRFGKRLRSAFALSLSCTAGDFARKSTHIMSVLKCRKRFFRRQWRAALDGPQFRA